MSNHPESNDRPDEKAFELSPPTRPITRPSDRQPDFDSTASGAGHFESIGTMQNKKRLSWKGFEEVEDDPDLEYTTDRKPLAGEMDMTPMVDVTFLLLIFFMVTVSFTIINSVEQPVPKADEEPTTRPNVKPIIEDCVVVFVDQYNTYRISVFSDEEIEAGSNFEMRQIVRQAVEDYSPDKMVIITHEESALNKLVAAYSAARVFGIGTIETTTTDRDF